VAHVASGVEHVDLSEVTFCSAAGVRALLTGRDTLPPGVETLRLTCSPLVLRVLHLCGLSTAERLTIVAADPPTSSRPKP
jgi:anti-anti-sigma regulatory factor